MHALDQQKLPTLTPTMLATFARCPQQYAFKYVQKLKPVEETFSPDLARGNAAHNVLGAVLRQFQRTQAFPINLQERAESQLPRDGYAGDEAWEADVEKVVGWVKWALMAFDGTARVVAVERPFEYVFPGNGDCASFRLRAIVDLVLEHPDGSIEHLDWKTGTGYRIDPIQNVVSRIVVGQAFPKQPHLLSSTAFLASETTRTDELAYDEVKAGWGTIKELAAAIMAEREFFPISNPLCPWCPFSGQGCSLFPASDAPDEMTEWLEGAA